MTIDTTGQGAAFPMRINAVGGLQMSRQRRKIRESIRMILGTEQGERVMRPNFGCKLKSLVFSPNNTATRNLARHYVERALERWEPRIKLSEVLVTNGDPQQSGTQEQLVIHVHYEVSATREADNLVYPFTLSQG